LYFLVDLFPKPDTSRRSGLLARPPRLVDLACPVALLHDLRARGRLWRLREEVL